MTIVYAGNLALYLAYMQGLFTMTKPALCVITTCACNIHLHEQLQFVTTTPISACTMCKYGDKLSLIAKQHETITINSFPAVYYA